MRVVNRGHLLAVSILALFALGMVASMLGTLMPGLPLTPVQGANVALAQAIGLLLSSVSVGPLIDAGGTKSALLLGLALLAGSQVLLPSARNFAGIAVLLFFIGAGYGFINTGATTLASQVDETRRSSILNMVFLFFGAGGLATPLIA